MTKQNLLSAAFIFALCIVSLISCNNGDSSETKSPIKTESVSPGKKVFTQYCVTCHGTDGKLGLNGAGDLSLSEKSKEEIVYQITNGFGMMPPYKSILSEEEIADVAEYAMSFK